MWGVLYLLLTFCAVCSVPAAQHANDYRYEKVGKEPMPDEEKEKNSSTNLDDYGAIDYDHTFPPSTSLPDADEFKNETTTGVSDGDESLTQPYSNNSSVAIIPYTEEEEFKAVQDKPRRTQPRKKPDSCGPPPSFDRTTIASGKNSTYGPGSVVTYSCQFGYVSDGLRQVKCTDDTGELKWSQSEIRCTPRSCGDPGYVDYGNRIGSLFTFPNRVSFECEDGYELKGNSARYCQPSGTWSGKLPKCQKLSCKPPPDIENGKVSYSSLEYGSELRYTCDPGFILKKHRIRHCAGNRTWSGEDPVCKDAQCDLPVTPMDGSFQLLGDKPVVDTRVIFKCDGNKLLLGNRVSICMENGEWTFPPPKCIDPCSIPRVPNGKIKKSTSGFSKEVPVGSVVDSRDTLYLTCDRNYEPLGKPEKDVKVKCTDGAWEDPPRCEPASCPGKYPRTRNGYETKINRTNGGNIWYGCINFFKKTQKGNITCSFGTWIGITPVCSDTRCYYNKLPINGLIKPREIFYDKESFTPACAKKYTTIKSDNLLKCESGEWKGHLPPCMPASCKTQPPGIDHGRVKSYSEDHSSVVEYKCEEGFTFKDQKSSKVECSFGEWKGTPPKCQDSRCYHKDLLKTSGLEKHNGFTPSGNFFTLKCVEGFTAVQNAEPYCSEGVWEQPLSPCKENSCISSKIQNGGFYKKIVQERFFWKDKVNFEKVALNVLYKPGDKLFVICESPFTFQGKGGNTVEVKCSNGQWQPEPVCFITDTPYPNKPKQEQQSTRPARVTSHPNVAMPPTSIPTLGPDEDCSCTYLNSDNSLVGFSGHELLKYGKKVKNGCRVKFYCRQFGYKILRGTELLCDRCKDWHSSEYPDCIDPSADDVIFWFSSDISISGMDEITLREAQSLDIYCYSHHHDTVYWQLDRPPKDVTFYPSSIELDERYSRPASVLRVTTASVLSSGVYRCLAPSNRPRYLQIKVEVVECPLIEESEVLSVNYEDEQKVVNSRVVFSCKKEGARLDGNHVLTCQSNGRWTGEIPRCNQPVRCPEHEKTESIIVDYINNDRYVGNTVAFHCFEPRKRIGESHASCKEDGTWSNPVPLCLLPNCSLDALFKSFPEDVTTDNVERKSDAMPYNSTVTLRCKDENHLLLGGSEATCKDGNWVVPNLRCASGCAPPQRPDDYLIVDPLRSSYDIGDRIDLACPAGMDLSSDVVRIMCLHEGWSETPLPSCLLLKI